MKKSGILEVTEERNRVADSGSNINRTQNIGKGGGRVGESRGEKERG